MTARPALARPALARLALARLALARLAFPRLASLALLASAALSACGEAPTEPIAVEALPFPGVVGTFAGGFQGEVGLIGVPDSALVGAFEASFRVRREGDELFYEGRLTQTAPVERWLYDCTLARLEVARDRSARFECAQGSRDGTALVLAAEGRFDADLDAFRGAVTDALGTDLRPALTLRRQAGLADSAPGPALGPALGGQPTKPTETNSRSGSTTAVSRPSPGRSPA